MKLVTAAQMRELDRRTIDEFGVAGEDLMERAGQAVAAVIRRLSEVGGFVHPLVHLIAGRGNNGGDAFVAARALKQAGYMVEVWLAGSENQIQGDARIHLSRMTDAGVQLVELPTLEDWQSAMEYPAIADVLVDGILGIGLSGPARGPAAGAIQYIASRVHETLCVAIDIPSGLNADTGLAEGDAVSADITVTMGLPKIGMAEASSFDYVGALEVADIGIPWAIVNELEPGGSRELIHALDLRTLFPRRRRTSHKGDYGHLLIIAGSRRYCGAASLTSAAAIRSGAGLVTALVPASIHRVTAGRTVELMALAGPEDDEGFLDASCLDMLEEEWDRFSAVVVGPGLGNRPETRAIVEGVLANTSGPVLLDADAINAFEGAVDRLAACIRQPVVITPHPGEMGRLMNMDTPAIQKNREVHARKAAEILGGVVVLKGAGTLVAETDAPVFINLTGNPGMATAGSGDVLAGVLGGFLAQGISPCGAARAAVYLHGKAGDLASWRSCQLGMTAGDILAELPFALRDITLR